MRICPHCGYGENDDGARFCEECGGPLAEGAGGPAGTEGGPGAEGPGVPAEGATPPEAPPQPEMSDDTGPASEPGAESDTGPEEPSAADRFRELLQGAYADGHVPLAEIERLGRARRELGLSEEEAEAIRREVLESRAGEGEVESAEVVLELNRNHIYMAGYRGVLELRARNVAGAELSGVKLCLCGGLFAPEQEESLGTLRPGGEWTRRIGFRPSEEDAGENLVDVGLSYRSGQAKCFMGQMTVPVLEKEEGPSNVSIDARGMLAEIEKLMGSSVKIDFGELASRGSSINDLLRADLPDNWHEVELRFDHAASLKLRGPDSRAPKTVHVAAAREPMDEASLTGVIEGASHNFLLLTRRQVQLGRDRRPKSSNNICLRMLPSTPVNDEGSFQISRRHTQVSVESNGVYVEDMGSKNGTFVDGVRLGQGERAAVAGAAQVRVGALALKVKVFTSAAELQAHQLSSAGARVGPGGDVGVGSRTNIEAVRIARLNNLPEEQYVLVVKEAKIGRSPGNAIVIPHPSVDEIHARIFFYDGQYWLEDMGSSGGTSIDGRRLEANTVFPLSEGAELTFGRVALRFGPMTQLHVASSEGGTEGA